MVLDPSSPPLPQPVDGRPRLRSPHGLAWWYAFLEPFRTELVVTAAALPLALLLVAGLVRWRVRRGVPRALARRRSLTEIGMLYGTVPFVWLTMLPGTEAGSDAAGNVDLVPLSDLPTMPTYQVVGNLAVFAAIGLLAPLRFGARASVLRVTLVGFAGSVLIESAQHWLRLDRVSSVDDVALNTLGAGVAACAGTLLATWAKIENPAQPGLARHSVPIAEMGDPR